MPSIDLELQLRFLKELEDALKTALVKYATAGAAKVAELEHMQQEVDHAKKNYPRKDASGGAEDWQQRDQVFGQG